MSYDCKIEEQAPQKVLTIRTRTAGQDLPAALERGYGMIMGYLSAQGEMPIGAPFVAYYTMDMADLDIEMGLPIARDLPGEGEVRAGELPAGKVASCIYTGPYDQMQPAYAALLQWIEAQGHPVTGVAYEFYLNDPGDTPPEDLQTKIAFPLK